MVCPDSRVSQYNQRLNGTGPLNLGMGCNAHSDAFSLPASATVDAEAPLTVTWAPFTIERDVMTSLLAVPPPYPMPSPTPTADPTKVPPPTYPRALPCPRTPPWTLRRRLASYHGGVGFSWGPPQHASSFLPVAWPASYSSDPTFPTLPPPTSLHKSPRPLLGPIWWSSLRLVSRHEDVA